MAGACCCYFYIYFSEKILASFDCYLIYVYVGSWSELSIVTICGEHADLFDADGLIEASDQKPIIIILLVGMTVSHCSGAALSF
jgi:hypothetical protein